MKKTATCRCGHIAHAHQHSRAGSDCGLCGCRKFRRRLLARMLGG